MPRALFVAALAVGALLSAPRTARTVPPAYTESSIVNSIDPAAPLPINGYVSIYGSDLAWAERTLSDQDLRNGYLPTELGGVRVLLDGHPAHLLYVSPKQVNFVVPNTLIPKTVQLYILRDGTAGVPVRIKLTDIAPAVFALDQATVLATHLDGSLVTRDAPAEAGEDLVIYASGLGQTAPPQAAGQLARGAVQISRRNEFRLLLNGEPCESVFYAGVTPGFAGLYQVNFRVPPNPQNTPELRINVGDRSSQEQLQLPLKH
jgi:uncharacterized protein (TIGR03437 family)